LSINSQTSVADLTGTLLCHAVTCNANNGVTASMYLASNCCGP